MSYKFSKNSINKMKGLHPRLILFFGEALKISKYDFGLTCGIRTAKKQNKLYQIGRTLPGKIITYCDGYKNKSRHQVTEDGIGNAGDIKIYINRKVSWNSLHFLAFVNQKEIRNLMKKYNIEWGGDWKNFKDYPHFQVREW